MSAMLGGWWAGARRYSGRLDLWDLAHRAGGFEALQRGGLAALMDAGVSRERAHAWVSSRPCEVPMGQALTLSDPRYPRALRCVPGAPPVLEVEGHLEALHAPCVAVVGTRSCTAYGAAIARDLGVSLAEAGVTVVSGLARGIDAHAHRGALRGRTVAVVGHGLLHTSPSFHAELRRQIIAGGGAVVSSFAPNDPARPWRFPVRNQWIAGLSEVVVVVEAPLRSGALITASRAAELARDVVVVPGRLGDQSSAGCLRLLSEGAEPLEDIPRWLSERFGRQRRRRSFWLEELHRGASLDELVEALGVSPGHLASTLSELELEGEVEKMPGQRYSLT